MKKPRKTFTTFHNSKNRIKVLFGRNCIKDAKLKTLATF